MAKFEITDKFIRTLEPPKNGNRIYFGDVPGFGVRVSRGGTIVFIYNYRVHGRQRRMKIGSYPAFSPTEARNKALKLQNAVENGRDPLEEKVRDREAPTMEDLAKLYLADDEVLKKKASTLRNERAMLKSIIQPELGRIRVKAIESSDISKLHRSLQATPYRANRVLALLSTMFSFAIKERLRSDNPCKGLKKFHEEKRGCVLSTDEMTRLVAAIDSYSDQDTANAIRLLMLTGSRENEVLQATWSEFDLEQGTWTKPSSHTKQETTEHVALNDEAFALVCNMEEHKKSEYLFPGNGTKKARVTIRRPWVQICKAAGMVEAIPYKGKRKELVRYKPTLRIHDLRHNFASYLVSSGLSLFLVGKLLGHKQASTTNRYSHIHTAPLREAANRFPRIFVSDTISADRG